MVADQRALAGLLFRQTKSYFTAGLQCSVGQTEVHTVRTAGGSPVLLREERLLYLLSRHIGERRLYLQQLRQGGEEMVAT